MEILSRRREPEPAPRVAPRRWVVVLVIGFFGLITLALIAPKKGTDSEPAQAEAPAKKPPATGPEMASFALKEVPAIIATYLTSPASAEYTADGIEVSELNAEQAPDTFILEGHVDSKNAFGVPLRARWQAGVVRGGDQMEMAWVSYTPKGDFIRVWEGGLQTRYRREVLERVRADYKVFRATLADQAKLYPAKELPWLKKQAMAKLLEESRKGFHLTEEQVNDILGLGEK